MPHPHDPHPRNPNNAPTHSRITPHPHTPRQPTPCHANPRTTTPTTKSPHPDSPEHVKGEAGCGRRVQDHARRRRRRHRWKHVHLEHQGPYHVVVHVMLGCVCLIMNPNHPASQPPSKTTVTHPPFTIPPPRPVLVVRVHLKFMTGSISNPTSTSVECTSIPTYYYNHHHDHHPFSKPHTYQRRPQKSPPWCRREGRSPCFDSSFDEALRVIRSVSTPPPSPPP